MEIKLAILGAGYVGLTTAACFAELGYQVACIDIDTSRIEALQRGVAPFYEPGLDGLLEKHTKSKKLIFHTELAELNFIPTLYLIAVGTPMDQAGSANMGFIYEAAQNIAAHMQDQALIIIKSTVPVGTAEAVKKIIRQILQSSGKNLPFSVVSNPEFLKQGEAVNDCLHPERIIVGVENEDAGVKALLRELYRPLESAGSRYLEMSLREAEMTKYVANALLATKISFMNEIAEISEALELDIENIKRGVGSDPRIGSAFLNPGCGYGGSCLPKDIHVLINMAHQVNVDCGILRAVEERNINQKHLLAEKLLTYFGDDLNGKKIALLGLAFKPETDDLREASSLVFLNDIMKYSVNVVAYDPWAMPNAQKLFPKEWFSSGKLRFVDNASAAATDADALVVVTEWDEFKHLDFVAVKELMQGNFILDGRNIFTAEKLAKLGFEYQGVGRVFRGLNHECFV